MKNVGGTSKFIGFFDECGDHSMEKIDKDFPIFLLCLTIIERETYAKKIVPEMTILKLKYWNHEGINLHSRDIRKASGPFSFLQVPEKRTVFLSDISCFMTKMPYTVFAICINKSKQLKKHGIQADNPYEIALKLGMELVVQFLEQKGETELPIIAESRGKREDAELEKAFYELIACGTDSIDSNRVKRLTLPLVFWDKRANISGLQMADLAAYPCARNILRPKQKNQAFEIIKDKIYKDEALEGWIIHP